jgi:Protein of unknown function (DUF2380)
LRGGVPPVWLAQLGSFAAQALTQFVNIYIRDASSGRAVAAVSADMRGNSDESWSRTPIGSFAIVCSHPATERANPLLAGVLAQLRLGDGVTARGRRRYA